MHPCTIGFFKFLFFALRLLRSRALRSATAARDLYSPATIVSCCPSPTPGDRNVLERARLTPRACPPRINLSPLSHFFSVEELARYFGAQLRDCAGCLWKRVSFDVAVSSGPGQSGIVRFAGASR